MNHERGLSEWQRRQARIDLGFKMLCLFAASASVFALGVLLTSVFKQGLTYLDTQFIKSFPSRKPEEAGLWAAMMGSIWVCAICTLSALPLGIGTAILLEEYQPRGTWARRVHHLIQLNISNLAGVPSIIYGIVGLTVFAQFFNIFDATDGPVWTLGTNQNWYHLAFPFGRTVLAGGLTLMLVVLPIIIISTQEALRAVPDSLREASLGLGSTKWQMVRRTVLPAAIPGIMTGSILAISRAIGEAAPVLIIAGVVFIRFIPEHPMDEFTVMPLQIYNWAGRPQAEFHQVAASGILVLLGVLLLFNATAVLIRYKFQKELS